MADDDVPLAALAKKPSLSKVNDDTPLSSLAGAKTQTPQRKSVVGGGAPKAKAASPKPAITPKPATTPKNSASPGQVAGKAKAKAGMKRRVASSSSDSYSYSYSDSDSEDGKPPKKKAAPKRSASNVSAKRKAAPAKKKKSTEEGLGDDSGGAVKKRDRSKKEEIVAELLCRWWLSDTYQKADWPPQDEAFYQEELKKISLRKVTIEEWEWVPEEEDGKKKVYELSQFRGVYRNSAGGVIDLRPKDTCPCYNNFMKKDMTILCKMLISAYENQEKELKHCRYVKEAQKTGDLIKSALVKVRKMYHEASQMK